MKHTKKQINKEDLKFYRKRIFNLFKEIISNNPPKDLSPDVSYSYDTFIKSSIHYFKVHDNNDLLQEEYNDLNISKEEKPENNNNTEIPENLEIKEEANKLMMRSIKMDIPTLDKYVKRISHKKEENIVLPKSREVDIKNPELKIKGIKKNITNIYEDKKKNKY
jgi:hypothetical protein